MNVDELDRNVTYVEDNPEQHDQTVWTCETGGCLAGHIALNNGYTLARYVEGKVVNGMVRDSAGAMHDVATVAQKILGATDDQVHLLFAAGNSVETLRLLTKDLQNGEDITERWGLMKHPILVNGALRSLHAATRLAE